MIDTGFQVLILIASLVGLASSSHFAVKSMEDIAEITGLSDMAAGSIILAVLTSAPELFVAIFSVTGGNSAVSIGDILGSNIFNIGAILGLLGMLGYLRLCCSDIILDLADTLSIVSLIPLFLVATQYFSFEIPSQLIGLILLIIFILNTYLLLKKKNNKTKPVCEIQQTCNLKKEGKSNPELDCDMGKNTGINKTKTVIILILSFTLVVISAQFTVYSASNIAIAFGVPAILVGAKLVAIGTSLPELTLNLEAVRRGRVQLAIGGVVGSNLANITLILGLVLLASPFQVNPSVFLEILPFLLITTIAFWRFVTKGGISRTEGTLLLLSYLAFLILVA